MTTRLLVVLAATAALTAAVPAHAAPKTMKGHYDISPLAPFTHPTDGCSGGTKDVSVNTKTITLPAKGVLVVKLTKYVGDWDLYLLKANGDAVAESSSDDGTANTGDSMEKVTYRKGVKGMKLTILACNWAGGPSATVDYVHTY